MKERDAVHTSVDPKRAELSVAPGHLLRRAQRVHSDVWSRTVPGVTSPQYAVLVAIDGWDDVDQKRVGELASLDKSNVADIIARLHERGWLQLTRDPVDRRRRVLRLTDTSAAKMTELTTAARAVQEALLEPVAPNGREHFIDLLAAVARIEISDLSSQHVRSTSLRMERTPGYLLRRAKQVHSALWSMYVRDVTGQQYAVLSSINARGALTLREIGASAALDSSSATDVVERLVRKGWVAKQPDRRDRRRKSVKLTEPAEAALRMLRPAVSQVQQELVQPLNSSETAELIDGLQLLTRMD